jgi:hypothetical protein
VLASEVAWDAVLASVPELPVRDTTAVRPDAAAFRSLAGRYELGPDAVLAGMAVSRR